MNPRAPIAITGVGCICAAGETLPACLDSLFHGVRNPSPPQGFIHNHPVDYPVFEAPQDVSRESEDDGPPLLRTNELALAAATEALQDAGWSSEALNTKRIGVCVGTTVGSTMNDEGFYAEFRQGRDPDMAPIRRFLSNNPAATVAGVYGLSGPCQTVVNACSSGTDAVGLGALWIRSGMCDAVIAGGADELCRVTYNGFISLMITDGSPCRPFDRDRKGLNLGEGAAFLILEAEETRHEREKAARAFVLGYGSACDAYHLTAPRPDGKGLSQAVKGALAFSGVHASEVDFVNAHGTATPDNDRVEAGVLSALFPNVPFLSTKGYTGHTLGAAGAIEAAFTVACLEQGRIPASIGFEHKDPELPVVPVQSPTTVRGEIAVSESLAFGGHNSAIVFSRRSA
jgi:3-oxoacyl-[acyl-carrier-protein] synthase-1/3-oxoacyl-[acyl-carrier-protein] synthase II